MEKLKQVCSKITLNDLGVLKFSSEPEYYDILENGDFTLCLFTLQMGQTMPLHDHPNMTVFSKVVDGVLRVKTYEFMDSGAGKLGRPKSTFKMLPLSVASSCWPFWFQP